MSEDFESKAAKGKDLLLAEAYVNDILRLAMANAKEE